MIIMYHREYDKMMYAGSKYIAMGFPKRKQLILLKGQR